MNAQKMMHVVQNIINFIQKQFFIKNMNKKQHIKNNMVPKPVPPLYQSMVGSTTLFSSSDYLSWHPTSSINCFVYCGRMILGSHLYGINIYYARKCICIIRRIDPNYESEQSCIDFNRVCRWSKNCRARSRLKKTK